MASLKGHTGSTGMASVVPGRWHPLILSARSQLAGPSPKRRGRLVSSSSSLDYACRGSINSHILTADRRLRDAAERDQSLLCGASFFDIAETRAWHHWVWKLLVNGLEFDMRGFGLFFFQNCGNKFSALFQKKSLEEEKAVKWHTSK